MSELRNSIKVVSRKTGLSPHVIRVWERRYGAVTPGRTDTNRRLYSDEEVTRLGLLRQATQAGHSIGNIATLPTDELTKLAQETQAAPPPSVTSGVEAEELVGQCLEAIRALNSRDFEAVLTTAVINLGQHAMIERVAAPLAKRLGDLWRDGAIMAAHEHFASSVLRAFLSRNSKPFIPTGNAPTLIVGTPSGQLHELGAVMVAAAANDIGWRVIYLGPSLPASEIAGTALQQNAKAVALSIIYPEDDPTLELELQNLRKYLPAAVPIIVGGRASHGYARVLEKIGAVKAGNLKDLYSELERLRSDQP